MEDMTQYVHVLNFVVVISFFIGVSFFCGPSLMSTPPAFHILDNKERFYSMLISCGID